MFTGIFKVIGMFFIKIPYLLFCPTFDCEADGYTTGNVFFILILCLTVGYLFYRVGKAIKNK